ncbi:putative ribonuclease H-like domain-containing protein [Tanacetum coccineum]
MGVETEVPSKSTAQALLARQRERKAKSILLLAIPDEYQLRFHAIKDAKTLWAAIKSRVVMFESKKMQKNLMVLQLFSNEDANQKFLRALPSSWNNVALIMRNKAGIDDLDINDLYNNLKCLTTDIKVFLGFIFKLSEAGHNSQGQASSSSYTDELMYSFFANQPSSPQLDDEELEQIDPMMIWKKWTLNGSGHAFYEDGLGYDWSYVAQDEPTEFALMDYTSNSSGSDTELDETLREKNDLKAKLEQFETSSKNLNKLINSQLSAKEKTELNENDSSSSEVFNSVFENCSSDGDDNQTNDRSSEVLIKEWDSDDENIFKSKDLQTTDKPFLKKVEFTNARNESVKPNKQAEKPRMITQNPKRMAKESILKDIRKDTGHREVRLVWNNAQRINHQNKFVPSAVLTRFGRVPVSAAKQSSLRAAASTSAVRPVNTVTNRNQVNVSKSRTDTFHKSHSPIRRPFYKSTAPNTGISNEKINAVRVNGVNTVGQTEVSDAEGNGVTAGTKTFLLTIMRLMEVLLPLVEVLDEKNSVLFNETECLVLSPDFKLLDESQVLLRVPRQSNMYSFDLKNVIPSGDLTCLFTKATLDESNLWHGRLGHVNFKTINKLVKGNLVRGFPLKIFENDHTCVACQKGKQHKASLTHDFSRFSWVFFLATKDETSGILKRFITEIENQLNHKVKVIRCDNGTEFKNREMNEFCELKGIKREFSVASTPQQNRVAERKNKTLIEAARTMLAYSLLPTIFWAEAVNTTCYVLNRVLVTKPHNKTPYELIIGRPPSISFMRRFECPVTILNTLYPLGKFDRKADEGFLVGYKSSDEKDEDDTADDAASKRTIQKPTRKATRASSTNSFNIVSTLVNAANASGTFSDVGPSFVHLSGSFPINVTNLPREPLMPDLEDTTEVQSTGIFGNAYDDDDLHTYNYPYADQAVSAEADFNNIELSTVLQVNQKANGIFISQDKYMADILKKFDFATVKTTSTPFKLLELGMRLFLPLLDNGFHRGQIDNTLFIKRVKGDILLVHVHVDDIIFGSTKKSLCQDFEVMMHKRLQMSSIRELTFFLGLQVKQKVDGIFISQDKYVADILKKFDFATVKIASTPLFVIVQDSPFELEAFTDSDYTGASLDKKSTTRGFMDSKSDA